MKKLLARTLRSMAERLDPTELVKISLSSTERRTDWADVRREMAREARRNPSGW